MACPVAESMTGWLGSSVELVLVAGSDWQAASRLTDRASEKNRLYM